MTLPPFVYTDDLGAEWVVRIPRDIGEHPAFGFKPLTNQVLPELRVRYTYVGPLRPRHIRIDPPGTVGPISRSRTVPVGTLAALSAAQDVTAADGDPVRCKRPAVPTCRHQVPGLNRGGYPRSLTTTP